MPQQQVEGRLTAQAGSHAKGPFGGRIGSEPIVNQRFDGIGDKVGVGLRKREIRVTVFEVPPSHTREPIALCAWQQHNDRKLFTRTNRWLLVWFLIGRCFLCTDHFVVGQSSQSTYESPRGTRPAIFILHGILPVVDVQHRMPYVIVVVVSGGEPHPNCSWQQDHVAHHVDVGKIDVYRKCFFRADVQHRPPAEAVGERRCQRPPRRRREYLFSRLHRGQRCPC
mmetsp:Transcript_126/g.278  ORF Transcript_126/g.278 Transcript_126/m.278 type:complete len:224 (-) Transcript_126:437-1108(-)